MADELLTDSGVTVDSLQRTINDELKPQSFGTGKRLSVSVGVTYTANASTYNVLGYTLGSDPAASSKVIIIGAHYDHWGKDVDQSVYPGANDDASGVAVMMEIARMFSAAVKPRLSVLFAAWSGEEEGFYGAYNYVDHPYFPLSETVAYINLDMVGYGHPLLGEVSEVYQTLRTLMGESAKELNIALNIESYSGGSDHAAFEEKNVQNLMFIYWPDDVHHTPADTSAHVLRANVLETGRLTALIALKLSEATVAAVNLTPTTTTTTSAQLATSTVMTEVLVTAGTALVVVAVVGLLYLRKRKD